MEYTYDEQTFSDLYKDTYGIRPRNHYFYSALPNEKQRIWNSLLQEHAREMAIYEFEQWLAVEGYEADIQRNLDLGAEDREMAIRWLVGSSNIDTEDQMFGGEMICHELNLPHPYAAEIDLALNGAARSKTNC